MQKLWNHSLHVLALLTALGATHVQAQFERIKGATISVAGVGQFTTPLTTDPSTASFVTTTPSGEPIATTVLNQQQFTTGSTGVLASLQFHPKPWAGIEANYSFTRYTELFTFNYPNAAALQTLRVPTETHEATAAYQLHPKRIPFQPFVNVGGGYIDFVPSTTSNQWRETGLLEAGFDLPTHNKHFGFRIQGRALVYRAPNFGTSIISTRSWRVTEEPSFGTFYTF